MSQVARVGLPEKGLYALTTITALYHLVIVAQLPTWFGLFLPEQSQRAISLALAILLIFLTSKAVKHRQGDDQVRPHLAWYDAILWGALAVTISA